MPSDTSEDDIWSNDYSLLKLYIPSKVLKFLFRHTWYLRSLARSVTFLFLTAIAYGNRWLDDSLDAPQSNLSFCSICRLSDGFVLAPIFDKFPITSTSWSLSSLQFVAGTISFSLQWFDTRKYQCDKVVMCPQKEIAMNTYRQSPSTCLEPLGSRINSGGRCQETGEAMQMNREVSEKFHLPLRFTSKDS